MRRFGLFLLISLVSSQAFAAAKINRYSSLSADYCRSLNRYASTGLDAAYYNPAGLTFGRDGLGIQVLNQFTYLEGSFSIIDPEVAGELGQDGELMWENDVVDADIAPVSPMIMVSYHTGDWAFSLATGIVGGGVARLDGSHPILLENSTFILDNINQRAYDEGYTTVTDLYEALDVEDAFFQAANFYGGLQLGAAYQVTDWLALSLGGKYIYTWGSLELGGELFVKHSGLGWGRLPVDEYHTIEIRGTQSGQGFSGLVGLHMIPVSGLEIAMKYESITKLDVTTVASVDNAGLISGEAARSDIPGQFTAGANYHFNDRLSLQTSFGYLFNKGAEIGELLGYDPSAKLENGWEAGAGLEYIVNDDLLLSGGYLYIHSGHRQETRAANRFSLNGHSFGAGGAYHLTESMDTSFGLFAMVDESDNNRLDNIKLHVWDVVLGIALDMWF